MIDFLNISIEFFSIALAGYQQQSIVELIAVVLAVAYLVFALRQSLWCWPCALVSTALFTWVFFDVSLFMESLLNVYYMAMAVYGYWSWKHGGEQRNSLPISRWKFNQHVIAISIITVCSLTSGYFLHHNTSAAWPYLDSFTTWASIVTTYMVARKIYENWYYWLVINSCALFLYIDRELYATALLMMIYLVLVIMGIVSWKRELTTQQAEVL